MRRPRTELRAFLAAYVTYDGARWLFAGHPAEARANARWIIHLEQSLHVAVEGSVQRALDSGVTGWLLSNIYMAAQLVVLPLALVWLYRRCRPLHRPLRDTILATWLLAVPVYALFPVAPPRLAGIGMVDSVSRHAAVALTGRSTIFYNQFAAVPSLHVGFAFAIGIALAGALRRRPLKALALLWGPTTPCRSPTPTPTARGRASRNPPPRSRQPCRRQLRSHGPDAAVPDPDGRLRRRHPRAGHPRPAPPGSHGFPRNLTGAAQREIGGRPDRGGQPERHEPVREHGDQRGAGGLAERHEGTDHAALDAAHPTRSGSRFPSIPTK
jgi:PAP2 superfamily